MHHDLILTFCDPITKENEYDIPFVLSNNSTAIKWLKILYEDIYINRCEWNNNRYVGFETNVLAKKKIIDELNHLIAICEKERPGHFNLIAHENMSQDDFNHMHVWFEIYRGELHKPHSFFFKGTSEFKYAVERFNELIHIYELLHIFSKTDTNEFQIDIDIICGKTTKLEQDDLLNFEFNKYRNTIYLAYIMRGKNIIDLWQDNDHHIGDTNVRPYKYLGSSFVFIGSDGWSTKEKIGKKNNFDTWFNKNSNYLNSLGFYKNDPKSTIGMIPLAHCSIPNVKSIIKSRQFLKKIKIFEE